MTTTTIVLILAGLVLVGLIGSYFPAHNLLANLKELCLEAERNCITALTRLKQTNEILGRLMESLIDNQQVLGQQTIRQYGTQPNFGYAGPGVRDQVPSMGFNQLYAHLVGVVLPPGPSSLELQMALKNAETAREEVARVKFAYSRVICNYDTARNRFPTMIAACMSHLKKVDTDELFRGALEGPSVNLPSAPSPEFFYPKTPPGAKNGQKKTAKGSDVASPPKKK